MAWTDLFRTGAAVQYHGASGAPPHNPASDYGIPSRNQPEWTVPYLTFQAGQDRIPRYSLTGGGFLPTYKGTTGFRGKEGLMYQPYVTPLSSLAGGGQVPSRTNFLTALFKNIFHPGTQ